MSTTNTIVDDTGMWARRGGAPSTASRSDPLSSTAVRLLAADLLAIQQPPHLPGTFLRNGRPIRKVQMVGVVVSVDRRETYLRFKLDDGTGCVPCILWTNQLTSAYFSHLQVTERQMQAEGAVAQVTQVKLGRLLHMQGRLSCFHSQLQITVSSLVKEEDPNFEVLHWLQAMQVAQGCYDLPPPPRPELPQEHREDLSAKS